MDVQIVIFLIFTSVTLVFNSIVVWFAYKAFANITTNVTETMRGIQTSDDAKAWGSTSPCDSDVGLPCRVGGACCSLLWPVR